MPSPSHLDQSRPMTLSRPVGLISRMQRRVHGGFTLAETMIATVIFSVGILGVYAMLLKSYNMVALSRHRDNGRALLVSFADEFLRLQTTDLIGAAVVTRDMFATTSTPTGVGLNWIDTTGTQVVGTTAGLPVVLGDTGSSQVPAVITRSVTNVDSGTGGSVGTVTATAAGWILQATFTINYQVKGRPQSQSYIVARSVR